MVNIPLATYAKECQRILELISRSEETEVVNVLRGKLRGTAHLVLNHDNLTSIAQLIDD